MYDRSLKDNDAFWAEVRGRDSEARGVQCQPDEGGDTWAWPSARLTNCASLLHVVWYVCCPPCQMANSHIEWSTPFKQVKVSVQRIES